MELAADATGGRRGSELAARVEGDGANGPMLGEALPLTIGHEPVRILEVEPGIGRIADCALADQQHMRRLLENRARERHGVPDADYARARSGLLRRAVHHGGIHLDVTLGVQHRPAPGVEGGTVLEQAHGGFRGVERGGTACQQLVPGQQRIAQRRVVGGLVFDRAAARGSRASVHQEDGRDVVHSGRS